jgi:hypothetical protein
MRKLHHLFVLLILTGLVFVQSCETLSDDNQDVCKEHKLDRKGYKEFQLQMVVKEWAGVDGSHQLKDAEKMELEIIWRSMSCYDVEIDNVKFNSVTVYIKKDWPTAGYEEWMYDVGTPSEFGFDNDYDYFSITYLAYVYFADGYVFYRKSTEESVTWSLLKQHNDNKLEFTPLGTQNWIRTQ